MKKNEDKEFRIKNERRQFADDRLYKKNVKTLMQKYYQTLIIKII